MQKYPEDAPRGPESMAKDRLRSAFGPPKLTEEERASENRLHERIRIYNRAVPGLRLQIPYGIVSLNLEICAEYYFKCRHARLGGNAARKIAELLTSFLENHPLEWQFSSWKNDLIAELVLGWREAGERWVKGYWKREQKMQRETAAYLSPKRTAASSAVFELELLALMDKNPELWIRPGFRVYAAFVNFLNRNWARFAAKKRGPALLDWVVREFRPKRHDVVFSDSELSEICDVYRSIESSHPPGRVPRSF